MKIDVQNTENEIVIKLPKSTLPEDIDTVLVYLRYIQLGAKSSITEHDVRDFVKETKGTWWEKNKYRFKDKEGFEDLD